MTKPLTTKEFIEKAKKIHGNKYDYSRANYTGARKKVLIHCNTCNTDFWQTSTNHLSGKGCARCKGIKKLTLEEFIQRAKKIHGNKYDYFKVKYINSDTKIEIFCNKCKLFFWQTPSCHLRSQGCSKCAKNKKLTTKEFIERAKEVHGDKYDYSRINYINNRTKILIHCNICKNNFWQIPTNHLIKRGCPKCGTRNQREKQKLTSKEFMQRAKKIHKNKYDYSEAKYIGINIKVKIFCNMCKQFFWQAPVSHLQGRGCPLCKGGIPHTAEQFIEKAKKIYGDIYSYNHVIYKNNYTPVEIICNRCNHIFYQTPNNHLQGKGCKYCNQSKGENHIIKVLDTLKVVYITQKRFKDCRDRYPLPFDFYLPDYNVCIEYQGQQHYKKYLNKFAFRFKTKEALYKWFDTQKKHDRMKYNFCKENGIKLIRIKYDDNIEKVLKKNIKIN